jgi:hypothetical protein
MTYSADQTIATLLPKQVLYQAELCPDDVKAQSLRASAGHGQLGCDSKNGTIRQHLQQSPEQVPKCVSWSSLDVLYNSPLPLLPVDRGTGTNSARNGGHHGASNP